MTATLVSQAVPITPAGIHVPVFSDGTPGLNMLAAQYPLLDAHNNLPADWPLAGVVPVFTYAGQSLPGMALSAPLSTSGPITGLFINAIGANDSGACVDYRHAQRFSVRKQPELCCEWDIGPGSSLLPIVSATPNFAYPSASNLIEATNYYTISGNTLTTACAAVGETYSTAWAAALIWNDV